MAVTAGDLAHWSALLVPDPGDLALAGRALTDTVAVLVAAESHPIRRHLRSFGEGGGWAVLAHVLDFDDLHMASTTHVSTVCVPAALATGGGARAYVAGAGVMARVGSSLGWPHYTAGWHATSTAGAIGAAVVAGTALGMDEERLTTAMALAVPAAGGVQQAFGTDSKPLQVGMAVDAGLRAAELAADGASADPRAVDQWFRLVGGAGDVHDGDHPAVPGGLAVKLFPCCYAIQRPIHAIRTVAGVDPEKVTAVRARALSATVQPLIHHRPTTGAEGKFSLEYGLAAALLDGWPGLRSFTDEAVMRPEAQALLRRVEVDLVPGGSGLLDDSVRIEVEADGETRVVELEETPGSPAVPPTEEQLAAKLADCLGDRVASGTPTWSSAAELVRGVLA